ncbi:hypothetical protein SAMN00120144_2675 [Hymenobacter roseosalivarius DSM 11622]|uniref:Uncharacterized protein n=1 Tax=Hymenobacter roseosalivarius DSM 11622 TaxID=645990 RepID=A0A1W1VJV6_9BACT|nr:anti-sigma factor [Hymenobacter roseosalivarius]SMB93659.1 hypothetical protein SAMN00120144_2675 [Hymenobacter roseosalivarius DSM 11622]
MSQTPKLPEAGGHNLQRALNSLPTHEPDLDTWPQIEGQLAADEAFSGLVSTLPAHEPDDILWDAIAARLNENAPATASPVPAEATKVRPTWPAYTLRRVMAIAASVLILLGVWWQQRLTTEPMAASGFRETVSFSEEVVAAPLPSAVPVSEDPLEQEGQSFIDAHCSSLPTVCQSGEFKSLRTQLTELEEEEKQLRQDARRFGESPELLRQQAQLISLKATVTRELVQLLIS